MKLIETPNWHVYGVISRLARSHQTLQTVYSSTVLASRSVMLVGADSNLCKESWKLKIIDNIIQYSQRPELHAASFIPNISINFVIGSVYQKKCLSFFIFSGTMLERREVTSYVELLNLLDYVGLLKHSLNVALESLTENHFTDILSWSLLFSSTLSLSYSR